MILSRQHSLLIVRLEEIYIRSKSNSFLANDTTMRWKCIRNYNRSYKSINFKRFYNQFLIHFPSLSLFSDTSISVNLSLLIAFSCSQSRAVDSMFRTVTSCCLTVYIDNILNLLECVWIELNKNDRWTIHNIEHWFDLFRVPE